MLPPMPSDEEIEPPVVLETGFENIVCVDGLPVVPTSKFEKLERVIGKIFSQVGNVKENGIYMPTDDSGVTKGFAFIEYNNPEEALNAVEKTNNYPLDTRHTFTVTPYSDFEKYSNVSEEYEAPNPQEYEEKENILDWLVDPRGIDQYLIRHGDETEIYWNTVKQLQDKPELKYHKSRWTDSFCTWSPKGTYLATFHALGIVLWGGPNFKQLVRFEHPGVKLIDFSPCENYLVTVSPQMQKEDPKRTVVVWDIRSGRQMRGFEGPKVPNPPWPLFKWSHDDKYFAKLNEGSIAIFETPSMGLLEKKSLKIEGVLDFQWSPTQNLISFYVPEIGNNPARVALVEIPSREEIRQKNLFNVSGCNMHWQSAGEYLALKVDRHTKTKKSTYINFEFLRIKEKGIPVENLEMKDDAIAFAWEPNGSRFAIIHTNDPPKFDVSFYSMMGKKLTLLKTLEKKAANCLYWSPQGNFIVLAGLKQLNGVFEFFNVNEMVSMGSDVHYMATSVDWDPTGRYVVTYISHWRQQIDTGFKLFNFQGKLLYQSLKDKFYQLLWRPRPPTLLSKQQQKDIRANYKKYAEKYGKTDAATGTISSANKAAQKKAEREEFEEFMRERTEELNANAAKIKELLGYDSDNEDLYEYIEEEIEEVLETTTEVLES